MGFDEFKTFLTSPYSVGEPCMNGRFGARSATFA
ncbi:hypothetical protein RLEG3_29155 [Rhizobium leguminosarum bv. trifolii WSM1689]|nr:hypothetical protein RLEG3_29155 [Rhizobium leguminosarum bv. trifolii WSM1689]